jgi:hypothetical protein
VYRITGEEAFLDWAKSQFDSALEHICSATGWTHEFLPFQNYTGVEACETCAVADRMDAGIQLALAGFPEYWDDVQRCALNYLSEAQFRDNSWMPVDPEHIDDYYTSSYDIRNRLVGSYVGWGAPNDLVESQSRLERSVQNCCGPHGAFGAYQAWHYAVKKTTDGVAVNLHVSRDSKYCTVINYQPASNKITVKMKIDGILSMRLPDWADTAAVAVSVNNQPCDFSTDGCHAKVPAIAGDSVAFSYPQREMDTVDVCSNREYRVSWKGDFVTAIDPPGTVAPLFQRDLSADEGLVEDGDWPPLMPEVEW